LAQNEKDAPSLAVGCWQLTIYAAMRANPVTASSGAPASNGTSSGTLVAQLLRDHQLALEQLLRHQQDKLEQLMTKQASEGERSLITTNTVESSKPDRTRLFTVPVQSQRTLQRQRSASVGRRIAPHCRAPTGGQSNYQEGEDLGHSEAEMPLIKLHDDEVHMPPRHVSSSTFVSKNQVQERLLPIVKSPLFQGMVCALIVGNAVFLAASIHYTVIAEFQGTCICQTTQNIFDMLKRFFFLAFATEIVMRLLAEQMEFCKGEHKWWNLFDVLCLASMAIEMTHVENAMELLGNLNVLRVLRMLRILRAARAVRLFQIFKQLRLMLCSVISCLVSMMWALVLIFMIATLAALYLEDHTLGYLQSVRKADRSVPCLSCKDVVLEGAVWKDDPVRQSLEENWNGMWVSIRSLIYAISGGLDWGDLAKPFWQIGIFPGTLFGIYVLLSTLGLLNVLVGIFVQEASEIAKWDKDLLVDGIIEKKEKQAREIAALFDRIDLERTGWLSMEELSTALDNARISALFEHLQVDISRVEVLVRLLDIDGNGRITREEFVTGVAKLQGKGPEAVANGLLREQKLHAKIDGLRELMCLHHEKTHATLTRIPLNQ